MFRRLALSALISVLACGTHAESGLGYAYPLGLDASGDNFLALRSLPSAREGYRIRKMGPDTIFKVIEQREEWYKISLPHGDTGWVLRRYVGCCAIGPEKGRDPMNVLNRVILDLPEYYAYLRNLIHERMQASNVRNNETKSVKIKFVINRNGIVENIDLIEKSDSSYVNNAAINLILIGEKLLELPANSPRDTVTVTVPLTYNALSKPALTVAESPASANPSMVHGSGSVVTQTNSNIDGKIISSVYQKGVAPKCDGDEISVQSCIAVVANVLGKKTISEQKYKYIASLSTNCNSDAIDRSLNIGRSAGQKVKFTPDINGSDATDHYKDLCAAALGVVKEPQQSIQAEQQPSPSQNKKSLEWTLAEKIEFANRLKLTEQSIAAEKAERKRAFEESPEGQKLQEERASLRTYLDRLSADKWIEHNNCLVAKQVFTSDVPGLSSISGYSDDDLIKVFDFLINRSTPAMGTYIFMAKNIAKYRSNASKTHEMMNGDGWLIDCIVQSSNY